MVRIMENVARFKTMTCQIGAIHTGMSEEDFSWRSKIEGALTRSVWGGAYHAHTVGWI